jgi:hypothetical protein
MEKTPNDTKCRVEKTLNGKKPNEKTPNGTKRRMEKTPTGGKNVEWKKCRKTSGSAHVHIHIHVPVRVHVHLPMSTSTSKSLSVSVSMDTDTGRDMDVDVDMGRFLQLNICGFIIVSNGLYYISLTNLLALTTIMNILY